MDSTEIQIHKSQVRSIWNETSDMCHSGYVTKSHWHTLSDTFSLSDTTFQRKWKFSKFKPFFLVNYGRFPICFFKKSLYSWIGFICTKNKQLTHHRLQFSLSDTLFFCPKLCHSGYVNSKFTLSDTYLGGNVCYFGKIWSKFQRKFNNQLSK